MGLGLLTFLWERLGWFEAGKLCRKGRPFSPKAPKSPSQNQLSIGKRIGAQLRLETKKSLN